MKYLIVLSSLAFAFAVRADEPKPAKPPISEKELKQFIEKMNPFGLVQRIREAQARAATEENLRKLGEALKAYQNQQPKVDGPQPQFQNWMWHLLPYLEQDNNKLFQDYLSAVYPSSFGARFESVSEALQAQLGLAKDKGLLISEVDANSTAAKAGLKKHDIILQWDGKDVANKPDEFNDMLRKKSEKKTVTAKLMRAGKEVEVKEIEVPPGMSGPIRTYISPDSVRDGTSNTILFPFYDGSVRSYVPSQWTWPGIATVNQAQSKILTTTYRQEDRFTARYQEGSLVITITGQMKNDVASVKTIKVIDGATDHRYESIDKTPEEYRDKARDLVKAAEKNQDRIEIQKGLRTVPFSDW
jgi:PDZ domain